MQHISEIIEEILVEWAYRVHDGMPNPKNAQHIHELRESMEELNLLNKDIYEVIQNLINEKENPILKKKIKYKTKDGEDKEGTVGGILRQGEEHPAYKDAKAMLDKDKPEKEKKKKEPKQVDFKSTDDYLGSDDDKKSDKKDKPKGDKKDDEDLINRDGFNKKDKKNKDAPNGPTQQEILEDMNNGSLDVLTDYQNEVESNREKGVAGMGGPVASEGESKYCKANNQNLEEWADNNKEAISKKKEELKNKPRNAEEKRTAKSLGLKPDSDEFLDYLSKREVWVDEEREKAKNDPDHVFHKKGKKGFKGIDEDYNIWMRVAFDGAITTKAHLNESEIDTSKQHKVVQSTTELDDAVQASLEDQIKNAKTPEDEEYAKRQLKNFKKFRGYHDTYAMGFDEKGRMTYVGISNKKDSQMRDPQNNTTPAQRLRFIKKAFGEEIAENVSEVIDKGVERVSNAQANSVKSQSKMMIDDDIVKHCETEEMKPYMSDLDSKAEDKRPGKFGDYLEKNNKDWSKMSTKEKLEEMQKFSQSKLFDKDGNSRLKEEEDGTYYKNDDGEFVKIKNLGAIGLPYEPFGKIAVKCGEAKINEETTSIKQDEKDVVVDTHTEVVNSLFDADTDEEGYHPTDRPDADNGKNTQGYISGVLQAVHIDSYIDMDIEDDNSMLIQMGINGVKSSMIRNCLAERSGYDGPDVSTPEGKKALKEHLRKRCRVTPGGEKVSIVDSEGNETELFKDQWRTAGTAQKVASYFGDGMRDCLQEKAAKK